MDIDDLLIPANEFQEDIYRRRRYAMVEEQIINRGVRDESVLHAMRLIPRHLFVGEEDRPQAYEDHPITLPAEDATISQPYIVAYMTELLALKPHEKVLEVGSGSGYQAAVLALIVKDVYAIERHLCLVENARTIWKRLNLESIHVRQGDGCLGWPEAAPFDAIMVTAYSLEPPPLLLEQLNVRGRLLLPIGDERGQSLMCYTKHPSGEIKSESFIPCRFVPLIYEG